MKHIGMFIIFTSASLCFSHKPVKLKVVLLKKRDEINKFDHNGYYTPLMHAIKSNRKKVFDVLLQQKDIDINKTKPSSPPHRASALRLAVDRTPCDWYYFDKLVKRKDLKYPIEGFDIFLHLLFSYKRAENEIQRNKVIDLFEYFLIRQNNAPISRRVSNEAHLYSSRFIDLLKKYNPPVWGEKSRF